MSRKMRLISGGRNSSPERRLVEAARSGDAAAFTELIRSHDDNMRGLAWQLLGDQSAMDDALQEAYLKAYRNLGSFREEARFSSWLYRIVQTTCIDAHRRSARRPRVSLEETDEPLDQSADPSVTVAQRDDLRRALVDLPEDQLAAVVLVDAEGLSYAEAAELLDVAPGTIASRVNRARTQLRMKLGEGEMQ